MCDKSTNSAAFASAASVASPTPASTSLTKPIDFETKEKIVATPTLINGIIRINVSGTVFSTTWATITSHGSNYISTLVETNNNKRMTILTDENGYVFIDRDRDLFALVLKFLRYGIGNHTVIPLTTDFFKELEFYGIDLTPAERNFLENTSYGVLRRILPTVDAFLQKYWDEIYSNIAKESFVVTLKKIPVGYIYDKASNELKCCGTKNGKVIESAFVQLLIKIIKERYGFSCTYVLNNTDGSNQGSLVFSFLYI